MIKSFEVISQKSSSQNAVATSIYENTTYGIQVQYPSDWSVHESNSYGELIVVITQIGNNFSGTNIRECLHWCKRRAN